MRIHLLVSLLSLSLSLSAALAAASEAETFSLLDGRTLTGFYDAEAKQLTLAGPVKMRIALEPGQIGSRQPADAAALAPMPELTEEQRAKRERSAIATSARLVDNRNQELDRLIERSWRQEEEKRAEIEQVDASIAFSQDQANDLSQKSARTDERIKDIEHEIAVAELRIETASVTDGKDEDKDKSTITVTQATLPTARLHVRKLRKEFDAIELRRSLFGKSIVQSSARRVALTEELDEIVMKRERMQTERAKNDQRMAGYQAALEQPVPENPAQGPEKDETPTP